jgi:monofunctional biosynthetic peptidoglycan transglycosylase
VARRPGPLRATWRRLGRALRLVAALYFIAPIAGAAVFGLAPPPVTPLMVIRLIEGEGLARDWTALEDIAPHLAQSVIAAEDNLFCTHVGFDWASLRVSAEALWAGERAQGGSTISMQAAKNLVLWPERGWLRKLLEPYPTVVLELLWSKRRIIEVYLNVVEWGHGVYGAEAAARHHFGKPARDLTRREAALLAAVLPNPRRWSAAEPTAYIARRARTIERRVGQLGPLLDCVRAD